MTTETAERFALVDAREHERTRAALELADHQRRLLVERLARVLLNLGKLTPFADFSGPELLLKAGEFCAGPTLGELLADHGEACAREERDRLREIVRPFLDLVPSSFYPADGSDAEPYTVSTTGPCERPDFTGADLAALREAFA